FIGQAISLVGTWMQSVALSWLVLEVTHSGTMIGLGVAAQFLPVLLLGARGSPTASRRAAADRNADGARFAVAAAWRADGHPLRSGQHPPALAVADDGVDRSLATELVALVLVGAMSTAFMATGNSTLQLTSDPSFRGRVMALRAVTFQGSTPIGGPIIGAVSEYASPRFGLALGALACLLGAALGAAALRRTPPSERSAP